MFGQAPTKRNEEPVEKLVQSRKRGNAEVVNKTEVKDEEDQENKGVKNKKSKTKQDIKTKGPTLANKMVRVQAYFLIPERLCLAHISTG